MDVASASSCFRCMQAMTADIVITYITHDHWPNISSALNRQGAKQRSSLFPKNWLAWANGLKNRMAVHHTCLTQAVYTHHVKFHLSKTSMGGFHARSANRTKSSAIKEDIPLTAAFQQYRCTGTKTPQEPIPLWLYLYILYLHKLQKLHYVILLNLVRCRPNWHSRQHWFPSPPSVGVEGEQWGSWDCVWDK